MKVKALKKGFAGSRREAGEVFNIDPKNFKGWMQKVEDPKPEPKKAEAKPKTAAPKPDSDLI